MTSLSFDHANALATPGVRVTSDEPFTPPNVLRLIKSGGRTLPA